MAEQTADNPFNEQKDDEKSDVYNKLNKIWNYQPRYDNQQQKMKWKLGAKCTLFLRNKRKWTDGEIVGSFSDESGEWVKVRCGKQVHEVQTDDPDLRVKSQSFGVVPVHTIEKLQMAAMGQPVIAEWLQSMLQSLNPNTKSWVGLCFRESLYMTHYVLISIISI